MRVAARRATWDGNEAAVSVAYRLNEVCCIYPITPASPMAELADQWSSEGLANLYGSVPQVIEMQSEAGAAGALHGCLQGGALGTTFTASQGLLLMIPELYKIAGELTPAVLHVAARSVAAQALSIFGDHADVMAVRQSGVALLASSSVQEAHDLAAVAQAATLASRIPFVHFFDGFRTSHELHTIDTLSDDDLRALIDERLIFEHRRRALSPEHPVVRGTSHNPDVAFQARETVNPFYAATPGLVQGAMDQLAARTGRRYHLVDYTGHPAAERVVVLMGSGSETARETVGRLAAEGEAVGALTVRLYRPFPADALRTALPPSVRALAVLDRCKEPGSFGEPLFLDVVAALSERRSEGAAPVVVGGRYGLSSKEFTPGMVAGVLDELATSSPKRRFTVGIVDDVTGTSLHFDPSVEVEAPGTYKAVFHGLGADGTVGATKNTIRILGARGFEAQGYFVYDSKKAGSQTVSHLRCATSPIKAPYLVDHAHFVACHHPELLRRLDVLATAAPGATVLLNWPGPSEEVFEALPAVVQRQVVEKGLRLYAVDAGALARGAGLGGRVNTVLQACFFALSNVVSLDEALDEIKTATARTYARQGQAVVEANLAVVDQALEALAEVEVPAGPVPKAPLAPPVPEDAPVFVRRVTAAMMTGRGDQLPVSALPADGTWPSGTARYEKRNVSDLVAEWDPTTCIQCGQCSFVCPHAVLRSRTYATKLIEDAPKGFPSAPLNALGLPAISSTLAVLAEDCTCCGLCVEACTVTTPDRPWTKAINMSERPAVLDEVRRHVAFFETLPPTSRRRVDFATVRGAQFLDPLFEFSGACEGCGETPYLKLLSQLFGDRAVVANATGCSSIYGGNLPTTPWSSGPDGRGPAWSNSLFEDNAEFGLGLRLAADHHSAVARRLLGDLRGRLPADLVDAVLAAPQRSTVEIEQQRARLAGLTAALGGLSEEAAELATVVDHLLRRSVWLVGGDGWAYDIGAGGLDHVLAAGRDVNVLVLDTEVYSNTGGQMSKATPLGAVAKFSAGGKRLEKKDLALQAMAYGNVYVARVAMGADPLQTLRALREAEAYDGPSLVIAYCHCIAHGIEMRQGLAHQRRAVHAGAWPLMRYDPLLREAGDNPFLLDSPRPRLPLRAYTSEQLRFSSLSASSPDEADRLAALAEQAVERRWRTYEEMATRPARHFPAHTGVGR